MMRYFLTFLKTTKPKINSVIVNSFTDKYLFCTNVVISITLSGIGDVLEQHYEIVTEELESWNAVRTRNMSISGMTIGVICHHWYKYLDKKLPKHTLGTVFKKIVIDQFVGSPLCISALFLTVGFLERRSMNEIYKEMKQKAWILYCAEWVVWPPAQFVNFYLLPTRFRVLYDNIISLGYDVYTSSVKHKDEDS